MTRNSDTQRKAKKTKSFVLIDATTEDQTLRFGAIAANGCDSVVIYAFPGVGATTFGLREQPKTNGSIEWFDTDAALDFMKVRTAAQAHFVKNMISGVIRSRIDGHRADVKSGVTRRTQVIFTKSWAELKHAAVGVDIIVIPKNVHIAKALNSYRPFLNRDIVQAYEDPAFKRWLAENSSKVITLGKGERLSHRIFVNREE